MEITTLLQALIGKTLPLSSLLFIQSPFMPARVADAAAQEFL